MRYVTLENYLVPFDSIFSTLKWEKYLLFWVVIKCTIYIYDKEMATHSSILAWYSPWTEEPCRVHGTTRVGHDLMTKPPHTHTHTHIKSSVTDNEKSCSSPFYSEAYQTSSKHILISFYCLFLK